MTTQQTLVLIIIGLIGLISIFSFTNTLFSKNETGKFLWSFVLIIMTMLIFVTLVMQLNYLITKAKDKCPEYEKVENVYKLKQ